MMGSSIGPDDALGAYLLFTIKLWSAWATQRAHLALPQALPASSRKANGSDRVTQDLTVSRHRFFSQSIANCHVRHAIDVGAWHRSKPRRCECCLIPKNTDRCRTNTLKRIRESIVVFILIGRSASHIGRDREIVRLIDNNSL